MIKNKFSKLGIIFIIGVFLFSFNFNVKDVQAKDPYYSSTTISFSCISNNPEIVMTWETYPEVESYRVIRNGIVLADNITSGSYLHTYVLFNTFYSYYIFPNGDDLSYPASSFQWAGLDTPSYCNPPSIPETTTANSQCLQGLPIVVLEWIEEPESMFYRIRRDILNIIVDGGHMTNYTDTSVNYNQYYRYLIYADAKASTRSADVTTGSCMYVSDITGPDEVTLNGSAYLTGTFTWGSNNSAVYGLRLLSPSGEFLWGYGGSGLVRNRSPETMSTTFSGHFTTVGTYEFCAVGAIPGDGLSHSRCMPIIVSLPPTYVVRGLVGDGAGSIEITPQTITSGESATFTLTPDDGYEINIVTGDTNGCASGSLSGNIYITGPITSECEVMVTFKETELFIYTVTGVAGFNGSVSPASQTVVSLSFTTLEISPNDGYYIESANGCWGLLSGTTFTTGPIADNCTVTVSFSLEAKPDLVASNTAPSSAIPNVSTILSSMISNIGSASTVISFSNFFQVATGADGGGEITDLASTTMSALAAGASAITEQSYTFPSVGTYSIRACADKSSSN